MHAGLLYVFYLYTTEDSRYALDYTKEENPGRGALDPAILFMMICPPLRLITALPSASESV